MRRTKYTTGGWFNRNANNVFSTAVGAGITAFVPGMQAQGIGMMAGGVGGMIGDASAPDIEDPSIAYNRQVMNRNSFNMNNRAMPNSFYGATGGRLMPEASNIAVASGNSHEQGGIQIPGGEIEDNESIVQSPFDGSTQVHSDMLGTADVTNQLADQKGKLEYSLQQLTAQLQGLQGEMDRLNKLKVERATNPLEKNKATREFQKVAKRYNDIEFEASSLQDQIQQIDASIEANFQQQEAMAQQMGMRDEQGMPTEGMEMGEQPMFQRGGYVNARGFNIDNQFVFNPNNRFNPVLQSNSQFPTTTFDQLNATTPVVQHMDQTNPTPSRADVIANQNNRIGVTTPARTQTRTNARPAQQTAVPRRQGSTAHYIEPMPSLDYMGNSRTIDNFDIGADQIMADIEKSLQAELGNGSSGLTVGGDNTEQLKAEGERLITEKLKERGIKGKELENLLPFMSNAYNAFANSRMARLNTPQGRMIQAPTMDAYVNVNPQRDIIRSQIRSAQEFNKANNINAAGARANNAMLAIQGGREEANIVGQADNMSRQIRNQNLDRTMQADMMNQQTDFNNQVIRDQTARQRFAATSSNIANIESKLQQFVSQGRMEDYQNQQMELAKMLWDGTSIGVEMDNILGLFKTEDELKEAFRRNNIDINSAKAKEQLSRYNELNNQ